MSYLINEMLIYLLLAALVGAFVGWWLKKISSDRNLAATENNHRIALGHLQADRDNYKSKCNDLNSSLLENETEVNGATSGYAAVQMDTGGLRSLWPYPVEEIEGVGTTYGNRLRAARIENTEQLLNQCCESSRQTEAAKHVKVEPFVVGKWVSMSDLMRIPGIRGRYAELLEASGIASVGEMARQKGATLAARMARVNTEEHTLQSVPDTETVIAWIESAKELPSKIKSLVPK